MWLVFLFFVSLQHRTQGLRPRPAWPEHRPEDRKGSPSVRVDPTHLGLTPAALKSSPQRAEALGPSLGERRGFALRERRGGPFWGVGRWKEGFKSKTTMQ